MNAPEKQKTKQNQTAQSDLSGLQSSLGRFAERGPAPVHLWNPENCGEIGLRVAADGTWYYQNSPIGRRALVRLFSSVMRKDEDGCHYLVTPVEKIAIEVEDAPFLAVEMTISGDAPGSQILSFTTNCGDEVSAGQDHPLRFARAESNEGIKPYILVRGRLEALVTRSLSYDLFEKGMTETLDGKEMFGVWSGKVFFPIAPAEGLAAP